MRALANYPRLRKVVGWFVVNWRWVREQTVLWGTLLVVLAAFAYIFWNPPVTNGELRIRIAGMVLQVAGVATVWWGTEKTRKLFHYEYSFVAFWKWIRNWPWRGPRVRSASMNIAAGTATLRATGQAVGLSISGATPEQRIAALEANVKRIDQQLIEIDGRLAKATAEQKEALKRESEAREQQTREIAALLKAAQTGGLDVVAAGAVWLVIGILFATIPVELAIWWNL